MSSLAGIKHRVNYLVEELEGGDVLARDAAATGLRLGLAVLEELVAIRGLLEGGDPKEAASLAIDRARREASRVER